MLRGDISNSQSFVFGFRYENSLVHYKDKTFPDKILNKLIGKESRAELDDSVLSLMNHIYWDTEYTVALVIDDENYKKVKSGLDALQKGLDIPFSRIVNVSSISQVTQMLNTGELSYYIDNSEMRGLANSRFAITSSELHRVLRKHRTI